MVQVFFRELQNAANGRVSSSPSTVAAAAVAAAAVAAAAATQLLSFFVEYKVITIVQRGNLSFFFSGEIALQWVRTQLQMILPDRKGEEISKKNFFGFFLVVQRPESSILCVSVFPR